MRDKDSILLEKAYFRIINEISAKYVDKVKDAVADKELSFNDIFQNKLRLKLPIKGTDTYNEIINQISKIKNFDHFDPQKKEVVKKITVDPKYGGGEKFQRINLGRAISLLDLPEEQKKKMLDWFANYSTNIPEMEDMGKYTIVLSRSPIDVLRMSDVGNITSCHSQGGQYFQCAIAEAKEGGPIAFVVNTEDLNKLSEEEFQFDEIFTDKERKVEGIDPISRLRIRRYVDNDTEESVGIPETRIYGKNIAGFYNTVRDFLKEKQFPDNNFDEISSKFKARKLTKTGGSYSDSSDSHMFNQMFSANTFYGSLPHKSSEDGDDIDRYQQFEEELANMQARFNFEWFHTGYDVDQSDDYVYYSGGGGMKFNLRDLKVEINDDFFNCLNNAQDHYDFEKFKRYNPDGKYEWEKVKPYGVNDQNLILKFKNFLAKFKEYDPTDFVEYGLSFIYVPYRDRENPTERNTSLTFICCFGDDCGGTEDNTDKYLDFLYEVKKYDEKAEEILKAFSKAIRVSGFAKSFDTNQIKDEDDLSENLQNFVMDEYGEIGIIKEIGSYPFPKALYQQPSFDTKAVNAFRNAYPFFLQNYINKHYKPKSQESPSQLKFKGFVESVNRNKTLGEYGIDEVEATYFTDTRGFETPKDGDAMKIRLQIEIKYDDVLTNDLYDLLMFLDSHIDDLINAAKYYILNKIYGYKSQYNDNLDKIFSKYFVTI